MSGICNFAQRTHKVVLAEKLAGLDIKLAAYNLFIQAVIALNNDIVDACLRSFLHTELQINRITLNIFFDRNEAIEQIAIVHIPVRHRVIIGLQTLFKKLLVIHVALLHIKHAVKKLGVVESVSDPCYIIDIVSFALFKVDIYINTLFIVGHNAVAKNLRIAVAFLIVFLDDARQVVFIVALNKFFLTEKVEDIAVFVSFFDGALEFAVTQNLVAGNVYLVHLYFVMLVDIDIDYHAVGL